MWGIGKMKTEYDRIINRKLDYRYDGPKVSIMKRRYVPNWIFELVSLVLVFIVFWYLPVKCMMLSWKLIKSIGRKCHVHRSDN